MAAKEDYQLTKLVSQRLKASRELCRLSQVDAAERLGLPNSANLSKIESLKNGAQERTIIPMSIIVQAARVYEVSTDYLLGLTDDWEADVRSRLIERTVSHWVYDAFSLARQRDMNELWAVENRVREISVRSIAIANDFLTLYHRTKIDLDRDRWESLKEQSESLHRAMEKLRLHKKDSRDQLVLSIIGGRAYGASR